MTKEILLEIAKLAHQPTGEAYLDDLFSRVDTAHYYRFLYHLVKKTQPALVVELGSYRGGSTAHMAAAAPKACIVAVDPEPQPEFFDVLKQYRNIDWRKDMSLSEKLLKNIDDYSVDICFVDTTHDCPQMTAEHWAWQKKMKVGGVMLFDDITLTQSMMEGWKIVSEWHAPCQVSLPNLHHSGFGAIFIP